MTLGRVLGRLKGPNGLPAKALTAGFQFSLPQLEDALRWELGPTRELRTQGGSISLKSLRSRAGLAPSAPFRARTVPATVFDGWRGPWLWNGEKQKPMPTRGLPSVGIGGA